MSKRPPNELESRLHQAALASSKKEITAKQAEAIIPDATARQNALNFLLGVGLLKGLTSSSGQLLFRAVSKDELVATKGLSGEENLVLSHIKSSGNEGIWTKHLKAKTSLHQTVIDRCIKTLTQKRLIKRVQSVQHITRKIYMLEGLEPSIALTGGPWYTDNELDTEFIQNLTDVCYKLISDISFPKRRNEQDNTLYPISNSPQYPTADHIRHSLKKARLTETELSVEHVEMLLNVLILDGKIEKIPAFGSSLWNADAISDGEVSEVEKSSKKKKRKKRDDSDDEEDSRAKRKKKKHVNSSDDDSDSSDDDSRKKKKSKKRRARDRSDSDSDSEVDRKRKKRKKKKYTSSESDSSSEDERERSRKKSKKKKKKNSSESESDTDSEDEKRRRRKAKLNRRSESPTVGFDEFDTSSAGSVYRAIRVATSTNGLTEAPCGTCPSFEFCKEGGPVNPPDCVYYGEWLTAGTVAQEVTTA